MSWGRGAHLANEAFEAFGPSSRLANSSQKSQGLRELGAGKVLQKTGLGWDQEGS